MVDFNILGELSICRRLVGDPRGSCDPVSRLVGVYTQSRLRLIHVLHCFCPLHYNDIDVSKDDDDREFR